MSKIDWTKPIETMAGEPAMLLRVLKNNTTPYVVMFSDGFCDRIKQLDEEGSHGSPLGPQRFTFVRNVVVPLLLYGRLHPRWEGDIEGLGWTVIRGKSDTHVIELTPEDLKRVMRPIKDGER